MRGFIRSCVVALTVWTGVSAANAVVPVSCPGLVCTIDTSGSTNLSGAVGNSYAFSFNSGGTIINAKVSGWNLSGLPSAGGTVVNKSYVGQWAAGFGVTSTGDNSGQGNLHALDNFGGVYDFLVVQFDKAVSLQSFQVTPYKVNGYSYVDTDATYGFGNTNFANSPFSGSSNIPVSQFNTLFPTLTTDNTMSNSARTISIAAGTGNTWIIGARMTANDSEKDAFKVDLLKFKYMPPPPAVPEPSTWIMMILGFGFVGTTMRRRKTVQTGEALAAA